MEVDGFRDLLVNYLEQKQVNIVVRGLRAVSDFEYELQLATTNNKLNPKVETFFMTASPQYSFLSSSVVKEVARFHGPVTGLVPEVVENALVQKYTNTRV